MFVNYAHRGASAYRPDSTKIAFDLGIEMKANGIETDVQLSKDGVPVLFHNERLDGRSSGTGYLRDHTLEELKQMDFGLWKGEEFRNTPIMTLEEFFQNYAHLDLTFAIELKAPNTEKSVIELIKKYNVKDKVFVSSFFYEYLVNMRKLDKDIRLSYLVGKLNAEIIEKMKLINGSQICPQAAYTEKEDIDLVNNSGMRVRMWGIGDSMDYVKKFCALDTDGMTINYPDVLYKYLMDNE